MKTFTVCWGNGPEIGGRNCSGALACLLVSTASHAHPTTVSHLGCRKDTALVISHWMITRWKQPGGRELAREETSPKSQWACTRSSKKQSLVCEASEMLVWWRFFNHTLLFWLTDFQHRILYPAKHLLRVTMKIFSRSSISENVMLISFLKAEKRKEIHLEGRLTAPKRYSSINV